MRRNESMFCGGIMAAVAIVNLFGPNEVHGLPGFQNCHSSLMDAKAAKEACTDQREPCCDLVVRLFGSQGEHRRCVCSPVYVSTFQSSMNSDRIKEWLTGCGVSANHLPEKCTEESSTSQTVLKALHENTMATKDGLQGFFPGKNSDAQPKTSESTRCFDVTPPNGISCKHQKDLGKCLRKWMVEGGFCRLTCGNDGCNPLVTTLDGPNEDHYEKETPTENSAENNSECTDIPPDDLYTCAEQKAWGKCDRLYIVQGNHCAKSCGRAPCPPLGSEGEVHPDSTETPPKSTAVKKHSSPGIDPEPVTITAITAPDVGSKGTGGYRISPLPPPLHAPVNDQCVTPLQGIQGSSDLMFLGKAVFAAGLDVFLNNPYLVATLIFPADASFEEFMVQRGVSKGELLADGNFLKRVLQNHIIPNVAISAQGLVDASGPFFTQSGEPLSTEFENDLLMVKTPQASGTIIAGDLGACQTIVHIVDTVLTPSG
ncbi:hypothetical protein BSKO_11379 [Bryopsis sp. KO-2023]|nr:hypothetical protein BSKO_11379 [Bryopsis sp. KO-2023]